MTPIVPLLDAKDVAERLNCHYRTVHDLRRRGELPAIPVGGVWRFDPNDIDQYIKEKKTHANA